MAASITLSGGSPWGFKMLGGKDFRLPLTIGKVSAGGKAAKNGVTEGYVIEKVNGEDVTKMSHHEALNRIKAAGFRLTLYLSKPMPRNIPESNHTAIKKIETSRFQHEAATPAHTRPGNTNGQQHWQINHSVAQSPSLYARTQLPAGSLANGDKPSVVISRQIQEMIRDDEGRRDETTRMNASGVRIWQPEQQSDVGSFRQSIRREEESLERSRAANNIGRFFLSSSAPRYGEPTLSKSLCDLAVPLGEPVVLEVRLGSDLPVPTVHWYRENKPARESVEKDIRILSNGPIHTLVLGELTSDLVGSYTCTIINKYGSKSTRCNVTARKENQSPNNSNDLSSPTSSLSIPNPSPPHSVSTRRVVASSSIGLHSADNIEETYQSRVNNGTPRRSFDDSEVMKVLRDDSPRRYHRKTPSMKYLEDSLLPESASL